MKVPRITLTILAVAALTVTLAAAETGVRTEAGEGPSKAPVSGKGRDAGSAPREDAGLSVAERRGQVDAQVRFRQDEIAPRRDRRPLGERGLLEVRTVIRQVVAREVDLGG